MFSNIYGHQNTKAYLEGMVQAGTLPSCILLHGPNGVGKRSLAIELAKRLNCQCGKQAGCVCPSCLKISRMDHLDVFLYSPDGDTFKIDQVRDIVEESNRYRMEGEWRVFILDGAEKLGVGAADALLKTLEDGRPNTVFILISASKASLVPTLASRSLDFFMGSLSYEDCKGVCESIGITPSDEHIRLGNGSAEDTQFFMSGGVALRDTVLSTLLKYPQIEDYKILGLAKTHSDAMDRVMDITESIFVDLLTLHITESDALIKNQSIRSTLNDLLVRWGWERCLQATYALLSRTKGVSPHQDKSVLLSLKDILR